MAIRARRHVLTVLLAGAAILALPGVAQATVTASYGTIVTATPSTPGSCGGGTTGCVTMSVTVTTARTGTLPATITVYLTLCRGTSTSSCTPVNSSPIPITLFPSPYKNGTAYTVTGLLKCKSTGTTSYFVKAAMSNTSATVTDFSAVKSQLGCLTV